MLIYHDHLNWLDISIRQNLSFITVKTIFQYIKEASNRSNMCYPNFTRISEKSAPPLSPRTINPIQGAGVSHILIQGGCKLHHSAEIAKNGPMGLKIGRIV